MAGTKAGGQKCKQRLLERYGEDYFAKIGSVGGKAMVPKGFALNPELASKAGRRAGSISKRGHKFIGEKNGYRLYLAKDTGEVVKYKYGSNS